ncbi:DUF4145 domain-containing protein [Chromobacterium haemolyticum]|nr:DUF4145 domain-containing protein [Chromobacterium haemolyticum]
MWDWTGGENSVNGINNHYILQCMGCDVVFYQRNSWDSESIESRVGRNGEEEAYFSISIKTFPEAQEKELKPDWVWEIFKKDVQLYHILDQTYDAYKSGGFILASVGLRTVVDRATELLKIDPGYELSKKVDLLLENGYIGATEAEILKVVVDAGNASAHRGWSPNHLEFQDLIKPVEKFIERTFIVGKVALDIANKVPKRQKRPPKIKGADQVVK